VSYFSSSIQVSERELDIVLDHLHTLNDLTPKIRCSGKSGVSPDLIFGIDSKQFVDRPDDVFNANHHDEVETATLWKGGSTPSSHGAPHTHNINKHVSLLDDDHMHYVSSQSALGSTTPLTTSSLDTALSRLSKESIYRVKGFVRLRATDIGPTGLYILNWAFGRYDLTLAVLSTDEGQQRKEEDVRLTVMGERGEVKRPATLLAEAIGALLR